MTKHDQFQKGDVLGRLAPPEMREPEDWLLTDERWDKALSDLLQTHFPNRWHSAEREIRSDRMARKRLNMTRGDYRASAEMPDEIEQAEMLLGEALPHLPEQLAKQVRQFLEK